MNAQCELLPVVTPQLLDAAGRTPARQTGYEIQVSEATRTGIMAQRMAELRRKQALPLDQKIALSLELIRDWYEAWDGAVSISYSGGKDSSVLRWLVRLLYPDVPAVFCHTGLEYPEVVRQVLATPHHVVLRPKMRFGEVVKMYGWPIASKKIARGVDIVRHPTDGNANVRRLYLQGVNRFGRKTSGFRVPDRWRFLFDAPFECSDRCCGVMKKSPQAQYSRESGRKPYVGTLASDSKGRERSYLRDGGCNAFDAACPRSAPLSFWTEQDVLRYILENAIPIPSVYGDIVSDEMGTLHTTGVHRTGCAFCCFGLHLDEGKMNRFELLGRTHPKLHTYVMEKLKLGGVLDWCRANAPSPLAGAFRWRVEPCWRQLSLLGVEAIREEKKHG